MTIEILEPEGIQYPYLCNGFSQDPVREQIDSVGLAYEMASTEDLYYDKIIAYRALTAKLNEKNSTGTFGRRPKENSTVLTKLIHAQREADRIEDKRRGIERKDETIEVYLERTFNEYRCRTENRLRSKLTNPKPTNGFVLGLLENEIRRQEQARDEASALVFFKDKTRTNISIYKDNISSDDEAVFARVSEEEANARYIEGTSFRRDMEAMGLESEESRLRAIYQRKQAYLAIARFFTDEVPQGPNREEYRNLVQLINGIKSIL